MKALVVLSLEEEVREAHQALTELGAKCRFPYNEVYPSYEFTSTARFTKYKYVKIVRVGDMGNTRIAAKLFPLLNSEAWEVCIMAGIAGSLNPKDFALGDVVVSASAKGLFIDKLKEIDPDHEEFTQVVLDENTDRPLSPPKVEGKIQVDSRKRVLNSSFVRLRRDWVIRDNSLGLSDRYVSFIDRQPPSLEAVSRDLIGDKFPENLSPSVKLATVYGSDFVIDSAEFVRFLRSRNDERSWDYYSQKNDPDDRLRNVWNPDGLAVVDMESYGFFQAMTGVRDKGGRPFAFAVRGVSDLAASKTKLNSGVRSIAARNAARVAIDLLEFVATDQS